jgi:Cys-tRNA(Pro)/Cys-tRNA(Cys) deacylase
MKEIFSLTVMSGAAAPLSDEKGLPAFIDESSILLDHIFVSAGIRGLQLKIAPEDLIKVTTAGWNLIVRKNQG